jgi:hypothetical protein
MEKKKIIVSKKEIIEDVICDCCGNSCKVDYGVIENDLRIDNGEEYNEFEYMSMRAVWGYRSNKDTQVWTAQICEKCVDEKFGFVKFKKGKYNLVRGI